jgi:hypothetical protein
MMPTIFLSYSSKDDLFAQLLYSKLSEAGVTLWRDQNNLRGGQEWREEIENGISESDALIVALSESSTASPYVMFEWAYALGRGKVVIPLKLDACSIHPRLQVIHYLDFSNPRAMPWDSLIHTVKEIETEPRQAPKISKTPASAPPPDDTYANAILVYLNQRGFQMASFDRLRSKINKDLTDKEFNEIIVRNPTVFRHATLTGKRLGIAKLVP